MIDFTIQRELPGQNILEIGYVGRLGRDLAGSFNLNSAPYFFKDNASGQTFAQAFDPWRRQSLQTAPSRHNRGSKTCFPDLEMDVGR